MPGRGFISISIHRDVYEKLSKYLEKENKGRTQGELISMAMFTESVILEALGVNR